MSDRFVDALAALPPDPAIDPALARRQHAAYRAALTALGARVVALPPDDAHPDGCFVEDTAVVIDDLALVTRPGAPSRRGEGAAIAAALAPLVELATMDAPATLDGGDCLRLGRTLYIGRSARTNAAGIARAAEVFAPRGVRVVAVDLRRGLQHGVGWDHRVEPDDDDDQDSQDQQRANQRADRLRVEGCLVGLHQATGHHDGKDDENGDRADVDEQLGHAQERGFQKDVDAGHADRWKNVACGQR